jgi:hypothetical protein
LSQCGHYLTANRCTLNNGLRVRATRHGAINSLVDSRHKVNPYVECMDCKMPRNRRPLTGDEKWLSVEFHRGSANGDVVHPVGMVSYVILPDFA